MQWVSRKRTRSGAVYGESAVDEWLADPIDRSALLTSIVTKKRSEGLSELEQAEVRRLKLIASRMSPNRKNTIRAHHATNGLEIFRRVFENKTSTTASPFVNIVADILLPVTLPLHGTRAFWSREVMYEFEKVKNFIHFWTEDTPTMQLDWHGYTYIMNMMKRPVDSFSIEFFCRGAIRPLY